MCECPRACGERIHRSAMGGTLVAANRVDVCDITANDDIEHRLLLPT